MDPWLSPSLFLKQKPFLVHYLLMKGKCVMKECKPVLLYFDHIIIQLKRHETVNKSTQQIYSIVEKRGISNLMYFIDPIFPSSNLFYWEISKRDLVTFSIGFNSLSSNLRTTIG